MKYTFAFLIVVLAASFSYSQSSLDDLDNIATIYFVRKEFQGPFEEFYFYDGEQFIGSFKGMGYFEHQCKPGLHLFWIRAENRSFLELEVEKGKEYYIEVAVSAGVSQFVGSNLSYNKRGALRVANDNEKVLKKLRKFMGKHDPETFERSELDRNNNPKSKQFYHKKITKYFQKHPASKSKSFVNIPSDLLE